MDLQKNGMGRPAKEGESPVFDINPLRTIACPKYCGAREIP